MNAPSLRDSIARHIEVTREVAAKQRETAEHVERRFGPERAHVHWVTAAQSDDDADRLQALLDRSGGSE